jgi:hypothetical protein
MRLGWCLLRARGECLEFPLLWHQAETIFTYSVAEHPRVLDGALCAWRDGHRCAGMPSGNTGRSAHFGRRSRSVPVRRQSTRPLGCPLAGTRLHRLQPHSPPFTPIRHVPLRPRNMVTSLGVVLVQHGGEIRRAGPGRSLGHSSHPCNTLARVLKAERRSPFFGKQR